MMRLRGYFLFLITLLVYFPSINGDFVWDDEQYIKYNSLLTSTDGLRQIWFNLTAMSQYYPLTFTTFWIEFQLWHLWPVGYHIVNIFIHGIDAILLWLVCTRLSIPGAYFAAAIFAIHPVHVDSVAQIAERKNVLSLLFYLTALLSYIQFANITQPTTAKMRRSWASYIIATLLFIGALLSKTTACSLPAVIFLIVWWKTDQINYKRDLIPLLPLFIIGLVMSGVTIFAEQEASGAVGRYWEYSFLEKVLIAGRAFWFYLHTLLWPVDLMLIYPKWEITTSAWWQYCYPVASLIILISIFHLRKRIGKGPTVALFSFAGNLLPVLGFFPVYFTRYSFVADHFQYLASMGPIVLVSAVLWYDNDILHARIKKEYSCQATQMRAFFLAAPYRSVLAGVILLCLGVLSWNHGFVYANSETIWTNTLKKDPKSLIAHNNLGNIFLERKEYQAALPHYQSAVDRDPNFPEAHYNLALTLIRLGRIEAAIPYIEQAVRLKPKVSLFHCLLGTALWMKGDLSRAVHHFHTATQLRPTVWQSHYNLGILSLHESTKHAIVQQQEAITHFEKALALNPSSLQVAYLMAWTLATSPDATVRNGKRAFYLAEQICQRTGYQIPQLLDTLAAAYAENGQFPEAIQTAQTAMNMARSQQQETLANQIIKRLELYNANKPYRDSIEQIRILKIAS